MKNYLLEIGTGLVNAHEVQAVLLIGSAIRLFLRHRHAPVEVRLSSPQEAEEIFNDFVADWTEYVEESFKNN